MQLVIFEEVDSFLRETQAVLEEQEAQNSLLLGIALRLRDGAPGSAELPFMGTVADRNGLSLIGLMTSPHPLVLASVGHPRMESVELLAQHFAKGTVSGVVSTPDVAHQFTEAWGRKSGRVVRQTINQRIYALKAVVEPQYQPGALRVATESDLNLVTTWMSGFEDEALYGGDPSRVREVAKKRVARREIHLWQDSEPRSMVGRSRETRNTVTINAVYTPHEWRRRGFATSGVAALSQELLGGGYGQCVLYTDLANPTSNSIYMRIGYRPVCDSAHLNFT